MAKIEFQKMRAKNFMSIGKDFLEFDFNKYSKLLITGLNGHGKSLLLEILSFSLFGKPFRNINKPQLVNTVNGKDLVVEIEFAIAKDQYLVKRGIKPSLFEIYKNGKLIDIDARVYDYQDVLENTILKTNHRTFCQTSILGSATYTAFMSLNKASRRDIIEDLLDLTIFTNMNVKLKEQINDNLRSIDNITADKRVIDEKIKIIKEHIKKSENSNKQIIDDKKERIADSIKTLNFKKSEIDELEINIKTLEKESKDDKKLRSKLHKFDSVRFQLESNIKSIRNDMTFFKENDDCPTCRQKIDNVFRDDSIFKCSHELKKLDSGIKELDEQRNIINDDINKNDEILSSLRELRFKKQTKEFECDNINSYIKTLEDEISQISSIIDIDDEIKKLNSLIAEKNSIETNLDEFLTFRETLSISYQLLKDEGIKATIIKQYIPIINKMINEYLDKMNFMCHFELDENFNESIKSRYRDTFSFHSFSEGQKKRISLAILFAFIDFCRSRNSLTTNILIMDEVFDGSLDNDGYDDVMKIVDDLTKHMNVSIISHNSDLRDNFTNIMEVSMINGFTQWNMVN